MNIKESAFNMCERSGTILQNEKYIHSLEEIINTNLYVDYKPFDRVYLGFEFCERMLIDCNINDLLAKIEKAFNKGFKVSFVFPLIHQSNISHFIKIYRAIINQGIVDELIVNDIGIIYYLRKCLEYDKVIIMGRMFEKSIRDVRYNLIEDKTLLGIGRNMYIFQPQLSIGKIYKNWIKEYCVKGLETDTSLDGKIILKDDGICMHIHYPDIYLTSGVYCEMDEIGDDLSFTISCKRLCCSYAQRYETENERNYYRVGNVMICQQNKKLSDCVSGSGRLVYSNRISKYVYSNY